MYCTSLIAIVNSIIVILSSSTFLLNPNGTIIYIFVSLELFMF